MIGIAVSKNNLVLLIVIAAAAVSLSILSYQYSTFTANQIARMASEDIKTNARIETYELSRILVHSINPIISNLKAIANSPMVQTGDISDELVLMNALQNSTKDLTDGYFWLDKNGKLLGSSSLNETNGSDFGLDANFTEYFNAPRITHMEYFSSVIESADKIPRLYMSFPIINSSNGINNKNKTLSGSFNGVMVATINVYTIGRFLQNELSPEVVSKAGLMDKNGVILYATNPLLIGKNFLGNEFQSRVPLEVKDSYNNILRHALESKAGAEDIIFRSGNITTISYQPLFIEDKHLWTLFIGSPHNLASDVGLLIDQQKDFSTLMVVIIGAIAIGIAFLILSWNKRLESAVNARTVELKTANDSLSDSIKLLGAANKQLEVQDKMQREFINIAAHELRTPIMPIMAEAEFIKNKFENNNEVVEVEKEQIALIIRNAKRLEQLASDILDVSKIESQSLKLNKEKFNLNDVISNSVDDIRYHIAHEDGDNGKIQVFYRPNNIMLKADKGRITQVIINLLSNAVKFTEEGIISVTAEKKDSIVIISVKDTGSGIDPEIFPRLFSKFATKSDQAAKSDKGTGLGLFISKNIVEAHGGKIWAKNNINGKGAIFVFSLPAQDN